MQSNWKAYDKRVILRSSFKTHHACPQARRCIQSHCAEEKIEHRYINGYKNAFERVSYFKIYISCSCEIIT